MHYCNIGRVVPPPIRSYVLRHKNEIRSIKTNYKVRITGIASQKENFWRMLMYHPVVDHPNGEPALLVLVLAIVIQV